MKSSIYRDRYKEMKLIPILQNGVIIKDSGFYYVIGFDEDFQRLLKFPRRLRVCSSVSLKEITDTNYSSHKTDSSIFLVEFSECELTVLKLNNII